jgi:imidazolonepropionase-like amidohydrolase
VEYRTSAIGQIQIDLQGLVVMPGLIDCHVHVCAFSADDSRIPEMSPSYVSAWAARSLNEMLLRGFTTVRDTAGADFGLARALNEGLVVGPRLLFGGPALSQTGGHADVRSLGRFSRDPGIGFPTQGIVCDGETEVRRATRHILRTGAHHIKMMLSGGITSPADRVSSSQFSDVEIRACVEEARAAGRYVLGHAYSAGSINRGLEAGVRSIEHGTLLDDRSIELFRRHRAFLVPTLVTYRALAQEGGAWGLSAESESKLKEVLDLGTSSLEKAARGGVDVAFGTDLLAGMQRRQCEEFAIRGEVQSPLAIIRGATTIAARLLCLEEEIGEIRAGFAADLIAVNGNPLDNIGILAEPASNLRFVMRSGQIVKNAL